MDGEEEEGECGICGENHQVAACKSFEITNHMLDNVVPPKAYLTLPCALKVQTMSDGSPTIVAKYLVKKGTKFGPLLARKLFTLDPSIVFPLKVFSCDDEDLSEYYLDTSDENECSWMIFVNPAAFVEEQNLVCYQENHDIYYVTLRDIQEGEYLKVWYSPHYAKKIKKPLLEVQTLPDVESEEQTVDLSKLITKQQKIMVRDSWTCKFCAAIETDVIKFSSHILEHYLLQLRKVCEICRDMFNTRKGLKKHLANVHSNETNSNVDKIKEDVTVEKPPQIENINSIVGGPLLNVVSNDSLDNSNIILQQTELNTLDMLESDNLNVDNLLNENVKELDHFNFDLDECQEQFVCDICLKSFAKLQLLVLHLRSHTGQYACLECFKIFARKESLRAHICNNNKLPNFKCDLCQKRFTQAKYLNRHMASAHTKKFPCGVCKKLYQSSQEQKDHNCPAVVESEKQTFSCPTCNKSFFRELYLRKHMKTHGPNRSEKENNLTLICEVCAQTFESKRSLQKHTLVHEESTHMCHICDKKFHRKDVLDSHLLTHTEPQFKCEKCDKTFKHKKNLNTHVLEIHKENVTHKCKECTKAFSRRSNLLKHMNVHNKVCSVCSEEFATTELKKRHSITHLNVYYKCTVCEKVVKLRSSLTRHMKKHHPDEDLSKIKQMEHNWDARTAENAPEKEDPTEILAYLENEDTRAEGNVSENVSNIIENYSPENFDSGDFENLSFGENIPNCAKDRSDESILDFNDLEMDLNTSFGLQANVNNREVCLSMPDLMEGDQEIMFGQNAYILDNGNVVEPQDEGKVIVYVLDQKFQT